MIKRFNSNDPPKRLKQCNKCMMSKITISDYINDVYVASDNNLTSFYDKEGTVCNF